MKKLFIISFILLGLNINAQSDKIRYKGEAMNCHYFKDGKLVNSIPVGKSIELINDSFFKAWTIRYVNSDGEKCPMKLTYIQKGENNYDRMQDTFGHIYLLNNDIKENKTILLHDEKLLDNGLRMTFEISGIILDSKPY